MKKNSQGRTRKPEDGGHSTRIFTKASDESECRVCHLSVAAFPRPRDFGIHYRQNLRTISRGVAMTGAATSNSFRSKVSL